jgi:peptide/nickel transport system substrate-binding protein
MSPLTRRDVLQRAAVAGGAGLILPNAARTAAAAPAAQETANALTSTFYASDPNPWTSAGTGVWTSLVFETLVAWDENYANIVPSLAETWETSDDGLVYTFNLRQDVTWHDGEPFTSADVVWSYTTLLSPGIAPSWLLPNLNQIKGGVAYKNGEATEIPGLAAPDDYTVEITIEQPSPLFIQQIAMPWILPKHLLDGKPIDTLHNDPFFSESLIGLGPFKFEQWERDQFLTIVRNDAYYRGAPQLDSIVARFIDQPSVAILSQENGELDAIDVRTPGDVEAASQNPNVDVFPGPALLCQSIGVGKKPEILTDKRVRQALLYALDRETMVSALWKGAAQIINVPFSAPWVPVDDVNPYPYDPERAKALLDEAGWDYDTTLEVNAYYTDQFTGQLLAAFQQYYGDIGIKTSVLQAEFENLEADYNAGNFGLLYQGSSSGPDPDAVYIYFHSESEYNTLYADPEVDRLLDEGRTTLDQAQRAEIYSQLAVALAEQNFWLTLWAPLRYWSVVNTIGNIQGKLGLPGLHIPFYTQAETWTKG